jgi:hypothetical protein
LASPPPIAAAMPLAPVIFGHPWKMKMTPTAIRRARKPYSDWSASSKIIPSSFCVGFPTLTRKRLL